MYFGRTHVAKRLTQRGRECGVIKKRYTVKQNLWNFSIFYSIFEFSFLWTLDIILGRSTIYPLRKTPTHSRISSTELFIRVKAAKYEVQKP